LCLTVIHRQPPIQEAAGMAPILFAIVLVWMAAFLLFYGIQSFRKALFALCCLFLMIPVPPELMERMTVALQHGSAATSFQILRLMGIPVFREGMTFMVPGLSIQVAPECSGIHSWLAFVMVAILAARVCLRSPWRILALIASTVPVAIFKNAVRIVTISTLTAYVDRTIIDGPLHHRGGPVFAIVDLAIFVPLLIAFQRSETRSRRLNGVMPAAGSVSGGLPPSAAKASVQ
jgi:exosortase